MTLETLILITIFAPLLGAALVGLSTRFIGDKPAQVITCGLMLASAVGAGFVFNAVALEGQITSVKLLTWIASGNFVVDWKLRVDVLTAVMLIVVTWVSTVVHLYSVGYMSHDEHKPRFMAYLSLFTFAMLMLITADNFVQLFFGWEGVGLCSYLLIGFWYKRPTANAAAIKAFLVNRVGDFGFALAIVTIFAYFGTVQFDAFFAAVPAQADTVITWLGFEVHLLTLIGLLLFIGCMGKSAQLFLHTWLPDAMEGPTPVSALIHAATMVTAGVFLLARCSPLYDHAPDALLFITIIGASTAFFAATIGMVQNDIKRVIAYSTCSQLGYMFFACGVSAYSAAIFHLMTHAFFKALLFLGAGSVIHAMSDEQDIRKMGGIWKKIPITYSYMWIGSLALAGLPLFAGFYSKDIILEAAYGAHTPHGQFAFWLGIAAALMTAFYSWRLLFLTFHGQTRAPHDVIDHAHEAPPIMWVPLVLLALGAVFSGYLGYSWLGMVDAEGDFWRGALAFTHQKEVLHHAHEVPGWVIALPIVVAASGIVLAWLLYTQWTKIPARLASAFGPVYRFLLNKWYFDEVYEFLFVSPAKALGRHLWKFWDTKIIDGLGPNGAAWLSARMGDNTSRMQTGYLYHYAFAMLIGLLAVVTWLVVAVYKVG